MKFSTKLALALSILSLFISLSAVTAQNADINSVSSPTSTNLNSVCVVNNVTSSGADITKLNAWAVGDSGTIVMWDGSQWRTVESPTSMNLYSVTFNNATNGWAVGGSNDKGVILYYNGTWSEWSRISFSGFTDSFDTVNNTLYAVTISNDGMNGWIVGAGGVTLNWNGDTWFGLMGTTANTMRSVAMIHSSAEAWAVGDAGAIMHWTGTAWEAMTSPTNAPLYAIQMISATQGWAAGGSNNEGVVLQLSGTTWQPVSNFVFGAAGQSQSTVNSTIYAISLGNANSAWASGSNGLVMYWTGTAWECNANIASGNLKGISMVHDSVNQAWVVGDGGAIMAFNGTNWVPELPIIAVPLILGATLLLALFGKTKLFKKPLLV
ncbi:hypothetical protein GX563_02985 [Candidatus Bathyarchaeota archaeon]|nr:hypothetical protein [Candidatus Bathyarchaeota archaeon]